MSAWMRHKYTYVGYVYVFRIQVCTSKTIYSTNRIIIIFNASNEFRFGCPINYYEYILRTVNVKSDSISSVIIQIHCAHNTQHIAHSQLNNRTLVSRFIAWANVQHQFHRINLLLLSFAKDFNSIVWTKFTKYYKSSTIIWNTIIAIVIAHTHAKNLS